MANIKISELEETQNASGFYALGVKENEEGVPEACRYNLGNITEGTQKSLNSIQGQTDLPTFNNTTTYYTGQFVIYNEFPYRFTETHFPGPWTGEDAKQTSVFNELKELTQGDNETVHFNISSTDGLLDVHGRTITITFTDGSAPYYLETDTLGNCTTTIEKGKIYTASVVEQAGYYPIAPYSNIKASVNNRYINFIYRKDISSETCTITANVFLSGSDDKSIFENQTVDLFLSGASTSFASQPIKNGVATFTNIIKDQSCLATVPKITGYLEPKNKTFNTVDDIIGLNFIYRQVKQANGIFLVDSEYNEYDVSIFPVDKTCIAMHVCTETLAKAGFDYYIRIQDLLKTRTITTKAWQTSVTGWKSLPNVPTYNASKPYYNGPEATYYMARDSRDFGETSPAAEYVNTLTFDFKGKTYVGYIGTRDQWEPIVNTDNKNAIYAKLGELGMTPTYFSTNIWTSTQSSNNRSWNWLSGSWYSNSKSDSLLVLPFFAI